MIKSIVILSCILAISQLGIISHASNQPDWSTGNDKRISIPNEKTIVNDQEKDGTNRTKRNVVLLIPVSTSEEADNSQEGELSEEVDELLGHGHKTKRCKAPNSLRKARRIPVMKNPQQYFPVSTESSVDNSAENSDEGRSYFRLASMKDAKNILKSILKSRSTKQGDNDANVETVSNLQNQASISHLTKSAKRSGQRGKKYVCYCIEDNCGSKKTKNPSRPYAMKRPIGPNVLAKSTYSGNEENQRISGSPSNERQTLGAPNNLQCPPGAVLVEESDYSEHLSRKYNPKRRPVKKCSSKIRPCDSEGPSIGQPTRINIPLCGNRKLNRLYKVDRKLPFAQKLQSVIEQNEAHREIPCPHAETSNNDGVNRQDYYNNQQSNVNQYAQIPLASNLVYPSPYALYPQYPQFPQYPQYDDGLVGEPQIPLQLLNPPCEEYQKLSYEATPLGKNFVDINECIKMFGRKFCIITTTTITSVPENAINYGHDDEEPAVGSHWNEEIEQSNTELYAKVYHTDNVVVTHSQEPESSDHVDDDGEDHLHDSNPYPPSRIAVTSGPYRADTTHYFSSQWENKKVQSTDNFSPGTIPSYGLVGSNQDKSTFFNAQENLINPNSPLRFNDPGKLEYVIPDSDESIESEAQDIYELGDDALESEAPNTLSSERISEFPQLESTIPSSSWQGAHRISSPQYLGYTVKPTEKNIPPSSSEDISVEITERIPTTNDSNLPQYEKTQYQHSTQNSHQEQGRNGNAVINDYTMRPSERVGITKQHTMDGSLDDDAVEYFGSSASPDTVYAEMEEPWVNFGTTIQPQHSKGNELQSSEEIITIYPVIDNEDRSTVSTSLRAQSIPNRVNGYSVSPSSNLYYSIQPEISTGDYALTDAKITSSNRQDGIVESIPVEDYPKLGLVLSPTSGNNGYASSDTAIKNTGFYTTQSYAKETKTASSWPQKVGEANTGYDFKESPSTPSHISNDNGYSTAARNFYPHFVPSHQSINDEQTTEKSKQQLSESDAPITENYISTLKSSDSVDNTADVSKSKYATPYEEYSFDTEQPDDVTNNYDGVASRHWYYTTQSGRKITSSTDRQTTENQSSQGKYVGTHHSIPSGITSTPVRPNLSENPAFYSDTINSSTTPKGHEDDSQRPTKTSPQNNFYSRPSERPSFTSNYRTSLESNDMKSIYSTGDDYSDENMTNNDVSQSILGTTIAAEDVGKTNIQNDEVSRFPDQGPLAFISTPSEYEHYTEGKSPLSDPGAVYTPIVTTGLMGYHQKNTEMASKYNFYSTTSEEPFTTDSHRVSTEPAYLELVDSTGDNDYSNEDTTNSYITLQSILDQTMAIGTEPSQKSHPFISTPSEYEHYNEGKSSLSDSGAVYTPVGTTGLVGDNRKTTEMASKYNFYSTPSEEPFTADFHRASTEPANSKLVHSTGNNDYSNEDTTNSYITLQSILDQTMAIGTEPSQKSHPFISTPREYEHYNEGKNPLSDLGAVYTPIGTTDLVRDHQKTTGMASKYNFYSTQSEEPFTTVSHRPSTESANLELIHSTGDDDYSSEERTNGHITSQSILGETMAIGTETSQKSYPFISTPSEYDHYNDGTSSLSDSGTTYTPIVTTGLVGDDQKNTEISSEYNFYSTQSEEPFTTDSYRASTESANLELVHSTGDDDYSNDDSTNSYITSQSILGDNKVIATESSRKSHPFITTPKYYNYYVVTNPQSHSLQPSDMTSNSYDDNVGDVIRPNFNNEESREKIVNDFTTMSSDDSRVTDRNDEINYSTIFKHIDGVTRPETLTSSSDYSQEYTTTHDFVGEDISQTEIVEVVNDYDDYFTITPVTQIIDEQTRPHQAKKYEGTDLTTRYYETISPQSRKETTKVADEEIIRQTYMTNSSPEDITAQRTILHNTQPAWNTFKVSKSTQTSEIPSEEKIRNLFGASHSKTQSSVIRHFENPSRIPQILNSENMVGNEMTTEVESNYDSTTNQYSQSILKTGVKNPVEDEYSEDDGDNLFSSIHQGEFTSPQPVVGNNLLQTETSDSDSSVYNDAHNLTTISDKLSTIPNERSQLTTHKFVGGTMTDGGSSTIKSNDSAFTSNAPLSTEMKNSEISRTEPTFSTYNQNTNLEDASLSNNDKIATSNGFSTETSISKEFTASYDILRNALKAMTATDGNAGATTRLVPEIITQQDDISKSITSSQFTPFFDKVGGGQDTITTSKENYAKTSDRITTNSELPFNEYSYSTDHLPYEKSQPIEYSTHPYESISSATVVGNTFRSQSLPDTQDVTSSAVEYEESRRPEYYSTLMNEASVGTTLKTHFITTTMPTDTSRPISTVESIKHGNERYGPSSSPSGIVLQPHYDDYQTVATIGSSTNGVNTEYSPHTQISSATEVDNTLKSHLSPESQDIISSIAEYEDSTRSEHDLTPTNDKVVESTLQMQSMSTTDTADILKSTLTDEPASDSDEEHDAFSSTTKILLQPYYTDSQRFSTHGSSTQNSQTNYSPYKSISTATVVGNALASQSFPDFEDVTSSSIEYEDSSSSELASISENEDSVGTALHTLSITTPDSAKMSSSISMPESESYHYDTYGESTPTNNIALQPHYIGYQSIPAEESPAQSPQTESSLHKISSSATLVGNTLESQSFANFEDVTSSSMKYEGSTSSEHDLTPMNRGSVGAPLHSYSVTTTQSADELTTNSAKESISTTSSTIGIELPPPSTGYHTIPKSDNLEEVVGNNHIFDKDQNFLRAAVQKVVNDLISPESNDAYKNGATMADTVGAPNQGLLTKLPILKNLFSVPEVKDLAISTVKGLITAASSVPRDSSLGQLEDHVIESVLNNVVNELIPGQTTPSSSMDVDEHRFENGRWTVVPATLVPSKDIVGSQPDDEVSSSIRAILGRPGIGLQGAKLPVVQNIIVRAVENVLKKAKNVVSNSVIWDTLNKIIARAENFDTPPRIPVPTTKPLPKAPGIKTPSAPMKNLPVIPITEHVFKNGQWSEKHTVLGNARKDSGPKLSTSPTTTSKDNNELRMSPFGYQSSIIETNNPDYTTKPVDYVLLGESEENSEETTLNGVNGMTDVGPNEPTIEAAGTSLRNQNIDGKEDLEKSPIKYFSPQDRILTYIKNHQTPAGKIPSTLSSSDTQHTTGYYRPWTVMESNEAGMDDESGKFQLSTASNNDKVPTGLTEEPRLGATEKKKNCKCIDEEEKRIDKKVGSSEQKFSPGLKTTTSVAGEENNFYSPSTIHHLDVEDGEDTDYTTEEFIGKNNVQMSPNSRKDAEMKTPSTESQEFSSTIHHLDVIEDNAYSTEEYISNENLSTEKTTIGMSEEVGYTQLSFPQSTVNYLYEDEESEEDATQEYTDKDNDSTTNSAEEEFTDNESPSHSTDSITYFDIGSETAEVGNTRNFDQGSSTTDVLKTTIHGEDGVGITRADASPTEILDKKISKLMKDSDRTLEATTASRGSVGAAKRPEVSELVQENLKDSPSVVTPKWDPTYFGRISPSNRANMYSDKISDLANTELFYVGDGVKIPLTIRRMSDGSYALSISEKICENFVNRECPCCVPKEGDIVEEKRQLNDPEDAEYETASSKNFYGTISFEPTESSEYENKSKKRYVRSTSGSDVIVTSASPVSRFIQKYNLTLNLKDDDDPIESSITDRKTIDEIRNKNRSNFSKSSHGAKIFNLFETNNMIERDDSEEERPIVDDNSEIISKESNTIRKSEFTYDSDTNSFIHSLVNIRDVPENKRGEIILNALDGLINSATPTKLDSTENQSTMEFIDDNLTNDQDSSDFDLDEVENEMARYGYQKDNPILERIRYIKKYQQGRGRYKYQQNIDHHAKEKMNVLKTVLHWLKQVFLESKANSRK